MSHDLSNGADSPQDGVTAQQALSPEQSTAVQHPTTNQHPNAALPAPDDSPENLPPKAWGTLIMFAAFVVLFGTCASVYLFK